MFSGVFRKKQPVALNENVDFGDNMAIFTALIPETFADFW